METQPMPICIDCKRTLDADGHRVVILKGNLFYPMSCIHCGARTKNLGTIEKLDAKRKHILVPA